MNIPPLCIIQARYNSTRLPGKMLLTLGGETLIARAWRMACAAFGRQNCIIAIPPCDKTGPLRDEIDRIDAFWCAPDVPEDDVLGRFHGAARGTRWKPETIIVRYTPDDWRKDVLSLRRVADGERLPVEQGGEAFTLAMLDAAHQKYGPHYDFTTLMPASQPMSEHISYALFDVPAPSAPDDFLPWSIDTQEDFDRVVAYLNGLQGHPNAYEGQPIL